MKKIGLVMLPMFVSFFCFAQRKDSVKFYLQQVASFIAIAKDSNTFILNDKPTSLINQQCLQQLKLDTKNLTKADLEYIKYRLKNPLFSKWTSELVPNAVLINPDTVFKNPSKASTYKTFVSYSAPIFLRNNKYCLFYNAYYCGFLCASGRWRLYKKQGAKWIIIADYCEWMS